MYYSIVRNDDVLTVKFFGRMAINNYYKHTKIPKEIISGLSRHTVVDVSGLTFIDSFGIGVLLVACEEIRLRGRTMEVVGASGVVERALQAIRLDDFFTGTAIPFS